MHENTRLLVSRTVVGYLETAGIETIELPGVLPDLNPIELYWDVLSLCVSERDQSPQTFQELIQALTEEWEAIPQGAVRRVIGSMTRRCNECIQA